METKKTEQIQSRSMREGAATPALLLNETLQEGLCASCPLPFKSHCDGVDQNKRAIMETDKPENADAVQEVFAEQAAFLRGHPFPSLVSADSCLSLLHPITTLPVTPKNAQDIFEDHQIAISLLDTPVKDLSSEQTAFRKAQTDQLRLAVRDAVTADPSLAKLNFIQPDIAYKPSASSPSAAAASKSTFAVDAFQPFKLFNATSIRSHLAKPSQPVASTSAEPFSSSEFLDKHVKARLESARQQRQQSQQQQQPQSSPTIGMHSLQAVTPISKKYTQLQGLTSTSDIAQHSPMSMSTSASQMTSPDPLQRSPAPSSSSAASFATPSDPSKSTLILRSPSSALRVSSSVPKQPSVSHPTKPSLAKGHSSPLIVIDPLMSPTSPTRRKSSKDMNDQAGSPTKKRKIASSRSEPYIEIPQRNSNTYPVSGMDLDDPPLSPVKETPSKARRTAATQAEAEKELLCKVQDYLEDVFSAEDMPDSASSEDNLHFTFVESQRNHFLSATTARQLTAHFSQIASSTASARFEKHHDVHKLQRLLKLLERSVHPCSDLAPIPSDKRQKQTINAADEPATVAPVKGKKAKTPAKAKKPKRSATSTPKRKRGKGANDSDESADESYQSSSSKAPNGKAESSPRRSARSRSESVQPTTADEAEDDELASQEPKRKTTAEIAGWSASEIDKLQDDLRVIHRGVLAIGSITALLTSARLPKQLYGEDLLATCLSSLKNILSSTVYPFAEAMDSSMTSPTNLSEPLADLSIRRLAEDVMSATASIIPRLGTLFATEEMPEGIYISAAYIAIGPFFAKYSHAESAKGKKKETAASATLKTLRQGCLDLLQIVSAKQPAQRQWIVEEILHSLTQAADLKKRLFRCQNGKSIHNISALLLHLIQSPAFDFDKRLSFSLARLGKDESGELLLDEELPDRDPRLLAASSVAGPAFEAAASTANQIVGFLLSKSRTASKSSIDADYKTALETLVTDMITVADLPDWPGSSILMAACVSKMIAALHDSKSSAEQNAVKLIALEHIGSIATFLSARRAAFKTRSKENNLQGLQTILTAGASAVAAYDALIHVQHLYLRDCFRQAAHDTLNASAARMSLLRWLTEVTKAAQKMTTLLEKQSANPPNHIIISTLKDRLLVEITETAAISASALLATTSSSDDGAEDCSALASTISWLHGQSELFEVCISRVLHVLRTAEGAAHRSRALRCLNQLVAQDSDLFAREDVRIAIEERFRDTQSSVRDAAFDLLGEYIVYRPDLAVDYLPRIGERITDTGLNVRKRVIRLLKRLFRVITDETARTDICRRLIWRIRDEDSNIKDMATATVDELLFSSVQSSSKAINKLSKNASVDVFSDPAEDTFSETASILINLSGTSKERSAPVDEVLRLLIEKKASDGSATTHFMSLLRDITQSLVKGLVESPDTNTAKTAKVACARTIEIFVQANPSALTATAAEQLLPYLQSADTDEDRMVRDCLLHSLRICVPHLPKSATLLFDRLQSITLELLKKQQSSSTTLQEVVACFCGVVRHQTHQYTKLLQTYTAVDRKLTSDLDRFAKASSKQEAEICARSIVAMSYMFALLTEHSHLDSIREENADLAESIDGISTIPIFDYAFEKLTLMYQDPALRRFSAMTLNCLGYLYRGCPTLMMREDSMMTMDEIFSGLDEGLKLRLLQIIQEFLQHQAEKFAEGDRARERVLKTPSKTPKKAVGIDMNDLIGNTDNFADSGVGSAVVQRYLPYVLTFALSENIAARNASLDIITSTVRQGLAHPVQCLPPIISLEASSEPYVSKRALVLHAQLHSKHPALVTSRFLECSKNVFDYQLQRQSWADVKASAPRGVKSGTETAQLSHWYSLLKDKRQARLDFVKALVKVFVIDTSLPANQYSVDFARYIADNLATLEYKTQEELFIILKQLNSYLADAGMQLVQLMQERMAAKDEAMETGMEAVNDNVQTTNAAKPNIEQVSLESLAYHSLVSALGVVLRDHLKSLYKLTDAKCAKFVVGKKSALGDKAPTRSEGVNIMLNFDAIPFLQPDNPMAGKEALISQAQLFEKLIAEDTEAVADHQEEMEVAEG